MSKTWEENYRGNRNNLLIPIQNGKLDYLACSPDFSKKVRALFIQTLIEDNWG